jgi:hypothetical protein
MTLSRCALTDRDERCRDATGLSFAELECLIAMVTVSAGFPNLPPWVTVKNVAERTGHSGWIDSHMRTLERRGLAERVGKCGRTVLWVATTKGRRVVYGEAEARAAE